VLSAQEPVKAQAPRLQVPERVPKKLGLQTGVHAEPLKAPTVQSPAEEFPGREGGAEQGASAQEPTVDQLAAEQVAERVPT